MHYIEQVKYGVKLLINKNILKNHDLNNGLNQVKDLTLGQLIGQRYIDLEIMKFSRKSLRVSNIDFGIIEIQIDISLNLSLTCCFP